MQSADKVKLTVLKFTMHTVLVLNILRSRHRRHPQPSRCFDDEKEKAYPLEMV